MILLSKAMKIIEKYQTEAPVKVISIARDMGIRVWNTKNFDNTISGMIERNEKYGGKSGYAIFVNAHHHVNRRRFTIAHEIGHYVLHEKLIGDGVAEDGLWRAGFSNRIEAQANKLAADILMPIPLIQETISNETDSIEALAEKFQVSRDAMSIRLLGVPYHTDRDN